MLTNIAFHTFAPAFLPDDAVVLDLGANKGLFSRKMERRYGIRCIAVEADPDLCLLLKDRGIAAYNLAITDHVGEISFHKSGKDSRAGSTLSDRGGDTVKVPCTDLENFVRDQGISRVDLLKMDIEGAELDVFAACSDDFLKSIPQITVEFHDFCGVSNREDVLNVLKRFKALGFDHIRMSRVGHQDTFLINRALLSVSAVRFAWAKFGIRNFKGAERVVRKILYGRRLRGYD
jgi:FkbM family methyltransferase